MLFSNTINHWEHSSLIYEEILEESGKEVLEETKNMDCS